jgi:hypothetical protein
MYSLPRLYYSKVFKSADSPIIVPFAITYALTGSKSGNAMTFVLLKEIFKSYFVTT